MTSITVRKKTTKLTYGLCMIMILVLFTGCLSLESVLEEDSSFGNANTKTQQTQKAEKPPTPPKTAYTGKTIAVPAPQFENVTKTDAWIPQFLQDSLTGHFASFSGMTVLDRKNESVVIAEQKLVESGHYSFDNAASFGQMTNAEYVLTGSVQKLPSSYALAFRVNDITTNEIKASFNGQYSLADIENGKAVQDALTDLFQGLGIPLTSQQLARITKDSSTVTSTKKLAQGMAAEKSGDYMTALALLSSSSEMGNKEAASVVAALFESGPPSILKPMNYNQAQTDKWNNIFSQLEKYVEEHYPIIVYDFSDRYHEQSWSYFKIQYMQGVKLVPNREVLVVVNTVLDEWERVKKDPANSEWINKIYVVSSFDYRVTVGLYNKYEELLNTATVIFDSRFYSDKQSISADKESRCMRYRYQAIPSQSRLFEHHKFQNVFFERVEINDKLVEPFTVRVISAAIGRYYNIFEEELPNTPPVFSLEEWEQYVKTVK